jgi:hypothetical protein
MMNRLPFKACLLVGLLPGTVGLAACTHPLASAPASAEAPACCQSRYPVAAFKQYTTQQLGQEYQRLRLIKCQACSYYGGDFHQIMKELGNRLNGQPRATVRRIMGQPDATKNNALLYYWRYTHDYLRFRPAANGTVVSSWYLALE